MATKLAYSAVVCHRTYANILLHERADNAILPSHITKQLFRCAVGAVPFVLARIHSKRDQAIQHYRVLQSGQLVPIGAMASKQTEFSCPKMIGLYELTYQRAAVTSQHLILTTSEF